MKRDELRAELEEIRKADVEKLKDALAYLKEGQAIALGEDTFSCGPQGDDKIYGFKFVDDELKCVSREAPSGYYVDDMEEEDLDYMFNVCGILEKIVAKHYEIINADEI